jgi:hypothetical protein
MGRPKGSKNKNKPKEEKIEETVVGELPVIKKRGRPLGIKNKPAFRGISKQETQGDLDIRIVWEHLHTGFVNYMNLQNNLELHKEDIPIFADEYRKRFKKHPKYTVIHPRNEHLIQYILEEFPTIGVGYMKGVSVWELRFCSG